MTNYSLQDLGFLGSSMAYYVDVSGATKMEYFCNPGQPDLAINAKGWKVMRIEKDKISDEFIPGKCIKFAGGTPSFDFYATDLVTVKAYSYS